MVEYIRLTNIRTTDTIKLTGIGSDVIYIIVQRQKAVSLNYRFKHPTQGIVEKAFSWPISIWMVSRNSTLTKYDSCCQWVGYIL